VVDRYRAITRLLATTALPQPDDAAMALRAELADSTLGLIQAPAVALAGIQLKLAILCQRLREDLHPDVQGELLSYLLAESIREDCRVMADGKL
jgi:hypothetical protein